MFPIGIRIWDQDRMVYPVKFSVYLNTGKNISFIKTTVEGKKYHTFNYMMLAPAMAINGYIYEKDIVMVDGEEQKTGVVVYDREEGRFVINTRGGKIAINSSLEFCEILGNVYEDEGLLKEMKISFRDEVVKENFTDNSQEEKEEIKKEVVKKETTPEVKKDSFVKKGENAPEAQTAAKSDPKPEIKPPWTGLGDYKEKGTASIPEQKQEKIISKNKKPSPELLSSEKTDVSAKPDTAKKETGETESKVPVKEEEKKPVLDAVDSNLIMGAEDLPYLGDEDFDDEPLDESLLDDIDIDSIEEIEAPVEELPPDDLFGNEESDIADKNSSPVVKVRAGKATVYAIGRGGEENGPGTYSYIIEPDRGKTVKNTGNIENTVINKIQLTSIIEALKVIEGCENLKIYSDSKYVIFPFIKGWVYKWQANSWIKDSGSPVKDSDLWEELCILTKGINIQWEFVQNINSVPQMADMCSKIGR